MNLDEALKIVKENGYIVINPTKAQLEDMKICEECGGNTDCLECSCSICLVQD